SVCPGKAVSLVQGVSGRWQIIDMGTAMLPVERPGFRGQQQGRAWRGLAHPLQRPRPMVRLRGIFYWSQWPSGGIGPPSRREFPAAVRVELRREAFGPVNQRKLREPFADYRAGSQPDQGMGGARPLPEP